MNWKDNSKHSTCIVLWALLGILTGPVAGQGSTLVLQGQSKTNSAWISGNLQAWKELDFIPCRIAISGATTNSQTVKLYFPHLTGTTPGFQDLSAFSTNGNVAILSGPTLTAPASGDWYYTFAIKYTGGGTAYVNFKARLAAGAHLNTGSSLMLSGDPSSMGNLQIHKPGPGPGAPDLAIVKSGPASAPANSTITYTLSYTNKSAAVTAVGAQVCDIVPADLTVQTASLPANAQLVGNTIFWDLTNLAARAKGQLTFQALIKPGTPGGRVITNFSQILSSENDTNMSDNCSSWLTTVVSCQPPCITNSPSGGARCPGDAISFSVVAGGTAPLSYQWRKGGTNIAGATGSTFTIAAVTAANAGSYDVVVSNSCGTAASAAALLAVNTPVSATPLTNLLRFAGSTAIFSTTASGTGPFTYTWQKNGTNISGQTGSSLALANLTPNDTATYGVIVRGACGAVTNSAILTVDSCFPAVDVMLVIDRSGSMKGQPYEEARIACSNFVHNLRLGTNTDQAGLASYNSSATLDQTLTNRVSALEQAIHNIPSATGYTSITLGLQTAQAELASARHHAQALPVLVLLSDGLPTDDDTPAQALAAATAAKNAGTRIFTVGLGSVDPALMAGIASSTNDFYFTTNCADLTGLFNAISTVICRPPTNIVVTGPLNTTVCSGSPAAFGVTASGCDAFTYQWRRGGVLLPGETNATLLIPNATTNLAGIYSVEIHSTCRSVTNSATLTVNLPVAIAGQSGNLARCPGDSASFSVSVNGTGLTYQWLKNGTNIAGATNSTYTIPSVTTGDAANYRAMVSGACGSVTSAPVALTVNSPVSFNGSFVSRTNCSGDSVTFSVSATGTGLTYQWLKNGTNIASATNSTYTIPSVTPADAGTYSVRLSGSCNQLTAAVGSLSVNQPVSVQPLAGAVRNIHDSVTFTAVASGTGPFTYVWKRDNAVLAETGSTLALTNLQVEDSGIYSVQVTGACGNAATAAATLVVNRPPLVSIVYPTNNSVFAAPATFSVLAEAHDPDDDTAAPLRLAVGAGTSVTNVEFFASTNNGASFYKLGETNVAPYFIVLNDLPANHYLLLARATDSLGATGDSALVNVFVVPAQPPTVTVVGHLTLNLQDGYQWLTNVVYNPLLSHPNAARVYIFGITNPVIKVVNPTGVTNGIPYVQSPGALQPGTYWTNVIKFYDPIQAVFHPVLQVELVPVATGGGAAVSGTPQAIFRNPQMLRNGTFLIEFATLPNRTYYIQYRDNVADEWETVPTPFAGNGMHLLWIDAGPPDTKSLPSAVNSRYYRVLLAP